MKIVGWMHRYDGQHWDTAKIRRAREYGWIRQNEARLIVEAQRRASASERTARNELAKSLRNLEGKACPRCGGTMRAESSEGVDVETCALCRGVFLGPGQLDELLRRHEAQRRGFLRRLVRTHGH